MEQPHERAQTAQKKIKFINKTLNDYMNQELNSFGSSYIGIGSTTSKNGMMMLHKHSKLLNFQKPLALANERNRLKTMAALDQFNE